MTSSTRLDARLRLKELHTQLVMTIHYGTVFQETAVTYCESCRFPYGIEYITTAASKGNLDDRDCAGKEIKSHSKLTTSMD